MPVSFLRGSAETGNRMKDSPGLHLKTYTLLLFIAFFAPLGNVLLSQGMRGIGSAQAWPPQGLFHILMRIFMSGSIWLGIACLLPFFVAHMPVRTWGEYSYAHPASAP